MKIKSFAIITLLIVLLASCNKSDYVNVVPADATFVATANFSSLAEKGDLGNSLIGDVVENNLSLVFAGKSEKEMKQFVESPQDMGIDFLEPAYVFQTQSKCVGMAMKMLDKGDFEKFVDMLRKQNVATKAKEKDGVMIGTLLDDMLYGYNGNTILLIASAGDVSSTALKQTIVQLFKQDEENSFRSSELFDRLCKIGGDLAFYANMAALPDEMAKNFKSFVPDGVRFSDIEFFSSLDFQKGKAVLNTHLEGNSDKAKKMLEENSNSFKKIEGRYTDMMNAGTFIWACVGMKGEDVLPKMKKEPQVKQMLFAMERAIDVEAMIKATDGDFAMTVPYNSLMSGKTFHLFRAQIKNSSFMDDVDYWTSNMKDYGMSMNKVGSNAYCVVGAGENFMWGVDGDNLFVGTESAYNEMVNSSKRNELEEYKAKIKNSKMFVYANMKDLTALLSLFASQYGVNGFDKKIRAINAVTLSSENMQDIELSVEIGEGKENSLKELLAK